MNAWRIIEGVWTLAIIAVLVAVMFALTGCATTAQCVRPLVQIERPVLPTVSAAEMDALPLDVWQRVLTRDVLLHQYAEQLELIVRELAEVPE